MSGRTVGTAVLLSGCLLLASCGPPHSFNATPWTDELESLLQEIVAEIGEARASTSESCRSIAFGAKPCGGPWRYLIYSVEDSDERRLQDLVARYNQLDQWRNLEEGVISDCSIEMPPHVVIGFGKCQALDADLRIPLSCGPHQVRNSSLG